MTAIIEADTMKTLKFTVRSEQLGAATYGPGDPRHYIAEMITALQKDGLPQKRLASLANFPMDLQRSHSLSLPPHTIMLKANDPEHYEAIVNKIFTQELYRIAQTARSQGKFWVNSNRIMPVVIHLQQAMQGAMFVTINANFDMIFESKPIKNLYGHTYAYKPENGEDTYSIDGMKITYKQKRNFYLDKEEGVYSFSEDHEPTIDYSLEIETCVDFSCLSTTNGKFTPGSKAITQKVTITTHNPKFKMTAKPSMDQFIEKDPSQKTWLRRCMEAIYSLIVKICCFLRKTDKKTAAIAAKASAVDLEATANPLFATRIKNNHALRFRSLSETHGFATATDPNVATTLPAPELRGRSHSR